MPVTADADVVIAVHDPRRDIARAVGSVLSSESVAHVIVVCHNTPVDGIAERLGGLADDRRVRLESLADGIRSPAGPFNHGLDLASAQFSAIMGSDDELAPGAVDAWLRLAEGSGADVVIPALRYAGGGRVGTPPSRPFRRIGLDGVRDRLAYRTAPIGLVSRRRFGELRLSSGFETGEDLAYSTRLWFSAARVVRSGDAAEYRIHDDAERVTFTPRPIAAELAAVAALARDEWVLGLGDVIRSSIAVKLWRIPVFGAVHYRPEQSWTTHERTELARVGAAVLRLAPQARSVLSRADHALIDAVLDASVPAGELLARSSARRRFATPGALLTRDLRRVLAPEAPLRFAAATWLAARGV